MKETASVSDDIVTLFTLYLIFLLARKLRVEACIDRLPPFPIPGPGECYARVIAGHAEYTCLLCLNTG